jgi:hypothetical protein
VSPDIILRCGFCQAGVGGDFDPHGISSGMLQPGKPPGGKQQAMAKAKARATGPQRPTACPKCSKPFPRCAICLLHLGEGLAIQTDADGGPFDDWFAWCQTCHHGGHSRHLSDWFSTHAECPVSNCNCRCAQLDPAIAAANW